MDDEKGPHASQSITKRHSGPEPARLQVQDEPLTRDVTLGAGGGGAHVAWEQRCGALPGKLASRRPCCSQQVQHSRSATPLWSTQRPRLGARMKATVMPRPKVNVNTYRDKPWRVHPSGVDDENSRVRNE